MKKTLLALLIFGVTGCGCNGQTTQNYATISATAFAEKINTHHDFQLVDVRTPEEYNAQHITNAKNINWNSNDFEAKVGKLDKSKPVLVYCMVGGRSKKAAEKLQELGFTEIYNLDGGIMKWNAGGFSEPSNKIIGMCSQEYGDLLQSDKKVLVTFYADWCEPCKRMSPYIKKMQSETQPNIKIIRLNADENKTLISELKIEELPALLLYQNKEVKWKHIGFISEEELRKQLQ